MTQTIAEREALFQAEWNRICGMYPKILQMVAALGSTPVVWKVDTRPPAEQSGNANYIFDTKITFVDGRIVEAVTIWVRLRDQEYDAKLVTYLGLHETGHIIDHLLARGGTYRDFDEIMSLLWVARGFPGSPPPSGMTGLEWPDIPDERFGDAFWAAHDPMYDPANGSQPAGGPMPNVPAMQAFFADLFAKYDKEAPPVGNIADPAGYLLAYPISQEFGGMEWQAPSGYHSGIDLAMPVGTPVPTVKDGRVSYAGFDEISGWSIIIDHLNGWRTWLAHADSAGDLLFKAKEYVRAGDVVMRSGKTGRGVTGAHLHWQSDIYVDGKWIPIDPKEDLIMLSDEAKAGIRTIVAEEVAKGSRAVADTMTAGFNVTTAVIARKVIRSVVFLVTGKLVLRDPQVGYPDDLTPLS